MTQPERPAIGDRPAVVIVGGGFSGAALAWHLHRTAPNQHHIVIIEPRAEIGRGLAYDSVDPAHRINVPALKMNLDCDEEGHFEQWLIATDYVARDPAAQLPGTLFPTRAAFGDYVNAHIKEMSRAITHRRTTARAIVQQQRGYRVVCDDGSDIDADIVVLAVCHTPPQAPSSLASLQHHAGFIADPWQRDTLRDIAPDDRVLIVGTGLTMADIVASLGQQNHRGRIMAVSRRGLRSQPHAKDQTEPVGDFTENPERTTRALLRRVRRAIAEAARDGLPWQPVLDQLRQQGTQIWQTLPLHERSRLIRHVRPFWDTYRFRIAPQVDDIIARRMRDGGLSIRAGSVRADSNHPLDGELTVEIRPRRSLSWERHSFDAVILATGPAHGTVFESSPLLASLRDAGLARPDPLGLGIDVDLRGRAIGRDGQTAQALFLAGPLARGTFGELMGVPDLARYARTLAVTIAQKCASRLPSHPPRA